MIPRGEGAGLAAGLGPPVMRDLMNGEGVQQVYAAATAPATVRVFAVGPRGDLPSAACAGQASPWMSRPDRALRDRLPVLGFHCFHPSEYRLHLLPIRTV